MGNLPDNDGLWNLLGRARPSTVSPYFSRRVLRAIRQPQPVPLIRPSILRWLGAGALALIAFGFFSTLNSPSENLAIASPEFQNAFDAAAGLDTLIAVEEVSLSSSADGL